LVVVAAAAENEIRAFRQLQLRISKVELELAKAEVGRCCLRHKELNLTLLTQLRVRINRHAFEFCNYMYVCRYMSSTVDSCRSSRSNTRS
jgi:hypothetical protein